MPTSWCRWNDACARTLLGRDDGHCGASRRAGAQSSLKTARAKPKNRLALPGRTPVAVAVIAMGAAASAGQPKTWSEAEVRQRLGLCYDLRLRCRFRGAAAPDRRGELRAPRDMCQAFAPAPRDVLRVNARHLREVRAALEAAYAALRETERVALEALPENNAPAPRQRVCGTEPTLDELRRRRAASKRGPGFAASSREDGASMPTLQGSAETVLSRSRSGRALVCDVL